MNPYQVLTNMTPFPFWNAYTPTLPSFYWNVDSQEERIKKICLTIHKLVEYADYLCGNVNENQAAIEELQEDFATFQESGFEDYYEQQLEAWVNANVASIFDQYAKMVIFGLDDEGHFVAYIPDSWSDITFDTGAVFGRSDYGRLILRFTAYGSIDNTYSYTLAQNTSVEQLIADVETTALRGEQTYDAVFTNMTEVLSNGNF